MIDQFFVIVITAAAAGRFHFIQVDVQQTGQQTCLLNINLYEMEPCRQQQ
jgi:hypothetical protein